MTLTSRLGQPNSQPGNVELGILAPNLPVNPAQSFTPTRFTGQLGTPLSYPVNVVPGAAFSRFVALKTLTASLPFLGTTLYNLRGRILFGVPATIVAQLRPIILKVVQRTTTQLDSLPPAVDVAVTETYPWSADVSNYLSSSDTVSVVTAILTLTSTGAVVTTGWQGAISTSGNVIQVPVNGPMLSLGQQYQLAITFTASSGKRLTLVTTVNVVA